MGLRSLLQLCMLRLSRSNNSEGAAWGRLTASYGLLYGGTVLNCAMGALVAPCRWTSYTRLSPVMKSSKKCDQPHVLKWIL